MAVEDAEYTKGHCYHPLGKSQTPCVVAAFFEELAVASWVWVLLVVDCPSSVVAEGKKAWASCWPLAEGAGLAFEVGYN